MASGFAEGPANDIELATYCVICMKAHAIYEEGFLAKNSNAIGIDGNTAKPQDNTNSDGQVKHDESIVSLLPIEVIKEDLDFMRTFTHATRQCARSQANAVRTVMDLCDQMLNK